MPISKKVAVNPCNDGDARNLTYKNNRGDNGEKKGAALPPHEYS